MSAVLAVHCNYMYTYMYFVEVPVSAKKHVHVHAYTVKCHLSEHVGTGGYLDN